MSFDHQPLNNASLSKQIADQLRAAIMDGTLRADERLPTEEELALRYEVSRPTIREALKRLAAQNLVRSRRGPAGGTFVNRVSREEVAEQLTSAMTMLVSMGEFELEEIDQARRELETLCCQQAAVHRTSEHLDRMQAEVVLQGQPELSAEEFCASDVRFHRALADASGNAVLQLVMYTVIEALQPIANMVAYRFREPAVITDQHRRLLSAIEQRDGAVAAAVIGEQIDYLQAQHERAQASHRDRQSSCSG